VRFALTCVCGAGIGWDASPAETHFCIELLAQFTERHAQCKARDPLELSSTPFDPVALMRELRKGLQGGDEPWKEGGE
jgi:hypothetical protein